MIIGIEHPAGQITESGTYRLTMEQYRDQATCDLPSVSSSDAVILTRKTPAHLQAAWSEPDERERKRDLGTCIHALILEPSQAEAQIWVVDAEDYKTKAAKEAAEHAFAAFKTPVLAPDYERAKIVAERVMNHKAAAKYLEGTAEPSLYAKDETLGIYIKARPDIVTPSLDMADIKTVGSCDLEFLKRRIYEGGWFQQCPWHLHVFEKVAGELPRNYRWICVEQDEPFAIRVIPPSGAALMHGARLNDKALRLFAACVKANYWPSYNDGEDEPTGLPDYAYYRLEADAERESQSDMRAAKYAADMELAGSPFS